MATNNGQGRVDVRRHNVSAVLRTLLDAGPMARVDLAASLSLSNAAVTRISAELLEAGVIRELAALRSADAGRRRVPVDLCDDRFVVAAVHIGLERTNFGLVGLRGGLVAPFRPVYHQRVDPESVMTEAVEAIAGVVAELPEGVRVLGTGFTAVGQVDAARGVVRAHAVLPWRQVDIAEVAAGRFPEPLTVESTYRTLARAETWFGAARNTRSLVHLHLGNAIGAGLVFDGRLHHGASSDAGDIAHLPVTRSAMRPCACGRQGCLVSVAGAQATIERATASGHHATTWAELERSAADGDPVARQVLSERIDTIGEAIATLLGLLAPERVVVVGVGLSTDAEIAQLRAAVARWSTQPVDVEQVVVPSGLATAPAVVASAIPILDRFFDDPFAFISRPSGAPVAAGAGTSR